MAIVTDANPPRIMYASNSDDINFMSEQHPEEESSPDLVSASSCPSDCFGQCPHTDTWQTLHVLLKSRGATHRRPHCKWDGWSYLGSNCSSAGDHTFQCLNKKWSKHDSTTIFNIDIHWLQWLHIDYIIIIHNRSARQVIQVQHGWFCNVLKGAPGGLGSGILVP